MKQHIKVTVARKHVKLRVEAQIAVSVSDLKQSPAGIMAKADGEVVAVLNHNWVMAYVLPADAFEVTVEHLDDLAVVEIAWTRARRCA